MEGESELAGKKMWHHYYVLLYARGWVTKKTEKTINFWKDDSLKTGCCCFFNTLFPRSKKNYISPGVRPWSWPAAASSSAGRDPRRRLRGRRPNRGRTRTARGQCRRRNSRKQFWAFSLTVRVIKKVSAQGRRFLKQVYMTPPKGWVYSAWKWAH